MTDPPIVGDLGVAVARRFRAPLLVISEDVFPEIATELGRLTNPAARRSAAPTRRLLPPARRPHRRDRRADARAADREGRRAGSHHGDPELGRRHARSLPGPRDNAWARRARARRPFRRHALGQRRATRRTSTTSSTRRPTSATSTTSPFRSSGSARVTRRSRRSRNGSRRTRCCFCPTSRVSC